MYSLKNNLAWMATATTLLFTAACPVDANEDPYTTPPPVIDCDAAMMTARVRILQGAVGLGTITRDGYPDLRQTITVERTFVTDPETVLEPALASLALNATANVAVCVGTTTFKASMPVLNADGVTIDTKELAELELTTAGTERVTLVIAGNVTGAGAEGVQLIAVPEPAAPEGGASTLTVVNAIPDSTVASIDIGADGTPEIAALARYEVSAATPIATPGGEISIGLADGGAEKASFTIERFPAGANLIAVLYNRIAIPMGAMKPPVRMFLTGSNPLVGNAPGNGIFVLAD
jgi:hypothetical protein